MKDQANQGLESQNNPESAENTDLSKMKDASFKTERPIPNTITDSLSRSSSNAESAASKRVIEGYPEDEFLKIVTTIVLRENCQIEDWYAGWKGLSYLNQPYKNHNVADCVKYVINGWTTAEAQQQLADARAAKLNALTKKEDSITDTMDILNMARVQKITEPN